jgi:Lrp/AsnC family transcriptional regulator of ectoine degradation
MDLAVEIAMKLDKYDLKILASLQADGRMTMARLAEQVGLTASPTWERVRKLEESGVLRGYHADVALEQLAQFTQIIVSVTLASNRAPDFRRFEQAVAEIPEVVECFAVNGDIHYILRFVVANIQAYQQVIERALQRDLGIERYWTYMVTKSNKPFAGVPLEKILPEPPEEP